MTTVRKCQDVSKGEASDPAILTSSATQRSGALPRLGVFFSPARLHGLIPISGRRIQTVTGTLRGHLPVEARQGSIRFADAVAEASPRFREERVRHWIRKFALQPKIKAASREISPLERHHEGIMGGAV